MQTNSDKENKRLIQPIWDRTKGGMPEKFIAVVLSFSEEKEDITIAINEWKYKGLGDGLPTQCICTHRIEEIYFIRNKINGNILRTGNDCIEKVTPYSKLGTDIRDISKQAEYRKRHVYKAPQHRMCPSCKWYRIRVKDIDRTHCEVCIENGDINMRSMVLIRGRICTVCLRPAIEQGDETSICERCNRIEKEVTELGVLEEKSSIAFEEYVEKCDTEEDRGVIEDLLVMGTKAISLKHIEDVGKLSDELAALLKEED